MTLANIDPRILAALRSLRAGTWSYRTHFSTHPELVSSLSKDLGYPAAWGDVTRLPAHGGPKATATWRELGVKGRDGIGGIPCELVHANASGGSCTKNAALRGTQAFASALALYLPVRPNHSYTLARTRVLIGRRVHSPGPLPPHPTHAPPLPPAPFQAPHHAPSRPPQRVLPQHVRRVHLGRRLPHAHAPPRATPTLGLPRGLGRPLRMHVHGEPCVRWEYMDRTRS